MSECVCVLACVCVYVCEERIQFPHFMTKVTWASSMLGNILTN